MNKKYVAISVGLIVFMIITIIIYNLVIKKDSPSTNQNGSNRNSTKVTIPTTTNGTVLCTRTKNGDKETIEFVLNNNKLMTSKFKFTKDVTLYGYESTSKLSESDKNYIQNKILKDLGLTSLYNNGITVTINYTTDVVIYVYIDFDAAYEYEIKKIGAAFERTNFHDTIKQLVESGEYICE